MGNCCHPIRFRRTSSAANPKNVTLLLLGLDNAGKTTIAKRLAGEPVDSVVPTIGFSVILLRQKGCHVSIYDLGGGPQIRDIWPRYYADAHGVIFVTDAKDLDRFNECRQVLHGLLRSDQISGKPVLLLANKQDLEGALDEIDVVDRLNLEQLVNEQKCPTLVELCSALNFSKKLDIGIENGYKWLIRSIVRDYPNLNNRVLSDLAKQEEDNKVHVIKRIRRDEDECRNLSFVKKSPCVDYSKRVEKILEGETQPNGIDPPRRKIRMGINSITNIPGQIEEAPERSKERRRRVNHFGEETDSFSRSGAKSAANSHSSEFFTLERFQSDVELLNDVPNQTFKSFLIRPKSSGARLYGVGSERKRTHRRKPLKKFNKTGPSPFTDISNDRNVQIARDSKWQSGGDAVEKPSSSVSIENVNPFLASRGANERHKVETYEMKVLGGSKSMPNSRKNSLTLPKRRRHSLVNGKFGHTKEISMKENGRVLTAKEIILDVTNLAN